MGSTFSKRAPRWIAGVVWGGLATLASSFGFPSAVAVLMLGMLLLRTDRVVAVSGPLTGFGAAWLMWLWRQSLTGGTTDGVFVSALIFGLLPLVVGLSLVTPFVLTWLRQASLGRR